MKVYMLRKSGGPNVLRMEEAETPQPGLGEVRVRVKAIGINYAEILSRKGLYGWAPRRPYIPGIEAAGEIDAVGPGCEQRKVGESVAVGTQFGCYAEYVVVKEHRALPTLPGYSVEENAAFPVNYMTAWVSLMEMARLRPSDTVLINPAAGGVGTAAVQIAKKYGCTVFGTAGQDKKIEFLQKLQIDGAVNYRNKDWFSTLKTLTQDEGVDVVLEMVGGDVYKKSLQLLRPLGRLVVAGFASLDLKKWNPISVVKTLRDIPRASVLKMGERSYGVLATHLGYLLQYPELMKKIWFDLVAFVVKHQIKPVVGRVFSFDELPEAHEFMESRQSMGKIVVRIPNDV